MISQFLDLGGKMQYLDNWNFKHEWRAGNDEWYPCHLYMENDFPKEDGEILIYTRNGSVIGVNKSDVRLMPEEKYKKQTELNLKILGKHAAKHGYDV